MRNEFLAIVGAFVVSCTLCAQSETKGAQRIPARETKGYMRHLGGDLIQPNTLKGRFVFFDAVGIPAATDPVVRGVRALFHIEVDEQKLDAAPNIKDIDALLSKHKGNACVILVDDANLPSVLSAPENKWTLISVASLKTSDDKLYLSRVRKELWRGFALTCGAGQSSVVGCVMNPAYSVWEVDALATEMISPAAGAEMDNCMKKMGIRPFRRVSYRTACREGWAPEPTNEYQKVIFEREKAKKTDAPSKGIKIKYDPKVGK